MPAALVAFAVVPSLHPADSETLLAVAVPLACIVALVLALDSPAVAGCEPGRRSLSGWGLSHSDFYPSSLRIVHGLG